MKQRSIYWTIFLIAVTGLSFFCFRAFAGTITTSITCQKTVKSNGALELRMDIRNNGDVTAYHVVVTLILADMVKKYDNLGNNPPGGKIEVEEKFIDPGLKPGDYVAVIRVDFEEESGTPHRVYHMVPLRYPADGAGPSAPFPTLKLTSPEFNRKAFWDKKGDIGLRVENGGKETLVLKARLFLPDGLSSPRPETTLSLEPETEEIRHFPVRLTGSNKTIFPYHVVAWYEGERLHHSRLLTGKIVTVERPVYFKWFVMGSGVLLGIVFLVIVAGLIVRRHRKKTEAHTV